MANKDVKKALEQFKMEAANEVGVNLAQGYNGDLTARQAGSIGGQMVKKMVESYENSIKPTKSVRPDQKSKALSFESALYFSFIQEKRQPRA